jgi:hypothetical protein
VGEEEADLFPKVRKILDDEQLEGIGQEMTATAAELAEAEPRNMVPQQTSEAPSLP